MAAALIATVALLVPPALASGTASPSTKWELDYHSVVPLGEDAVLLQPAKRVLYFLASAQSYEFEGWRDIMDDANNKSVLLDRSGNPVERFPRFVDFRVTVSTRPKALPQLDPFTLDCESECDGDNDYLLNLNFRVRIFHGLQVTVLEPRVVKLIGMPLDVPYDERVYRVSFDLGEVPTTDRIVLEVLSPEGERLTKFHLDL